MKCVSSIAAHGNYPYAFGVSACNGSSTGRPRASRGWTRKKTTRSAHLVEITACEYSAGSDLQL